MVGGLYTEPKVHYVAVLHHVVLALQAEPLDARGFLI